MEAMPQGWLAAARAGDADAAEQLITAYHARVFAFLRRLCGNESDAEDLTQRTFARVWTSLGSFAGRSSVSSWIHGIAHHVYLDWRRSDRRGEPQTDDWWASRPAFGPGPAEIAVSADLATAAYAAVDQLDAESRSAVHLHYYQGLTLQETAEALDVSVGTVKNRLRSALDDLQSRLGREPVVPPASQPHPRRS